MPNIKLKKQYKTKPGAQSNFHTPKDSTDNTKGISTFGDKPELVGPDHLQDLFDQALEEIPQEYVASTPIFLLATAGMRLLPDHQRKQLLDRICAYTRVNTGFKVTSCDKHIQVIPGETEGLYGWIATNYLLGGFDRPDKHVHGKGHHTYGFLDMGGASSQIAFAPNATEADKHANDLKLVRLRKINGNIDEYKVFVTTWLEFGVHEARRRCVEALLEKYGSGKGEVPDPCLPKGLTISTKGDILTPDRINGKEVHMVGTADFKECLRSTFPLLNKDKPCSDAPCLLNGVHVPSIDFDVNHFVGVSEYWHTTHEIFEFAHKDKSYDWKSYQERVEEFCTKDWLEIAEGVKAHEWGKKVTEMTTAEVCFKASWLINMLHEGIGVPRVGLENLPGSGDNTTSDLIDSAQKHKDTGYSDPFQAVNTIDDTEVSWTLGKMVLYAASEITPSKTSSLPVGFGPNKPGVPVDFQVAGIYHPPRPNSTAEDPVDSNLSGSGESWRDTLFNGATPRRVPGFLLFMLILCIAVLLLCGKDRRSRFLKKIFPFSSRRLGRKGRSLFITKPSFMSTSSLQSLHNEQRQSLLESGTLADPADFELGSVDNTPAIGAGFGGEEDLYSDDSGSMRKGRTAGWNTPRLRMGTPKLESSFGGSSSSDGPRAGLTRGHSSRVGLSGHDNSGSESSGLFIRTDSRESLRDGLGGLVLEPQRRSRSRRTSPSRKGGGKSPLVGGMSKIED